MTSSYLFMLLTMLFQLHTATTCAANASISPSQKPHQTINHQPPRQRETCETSRSEALFSPIIGVWPVTLNGSFVAPGPLPVKRWGTSGFTTKDQHHIIRNDLGRCQDVPQRPRWSPKR